MRARFRRTRREAKSGAGRVQDGAGAGRDGGELVRPGSGLVRRPLPFATAPSSRVRPTDEGPSFAHSRATGAIEDLDAGRHGEVVLPRPSA
jgi:hypothetical protein